MVTIPIPFTGAFDCKILELADRFQDANPVRPILDRFAAVAAPRANMAKNESAKPETLKPVSKPRYSLRKGLGWMQGHGG